MLESGQLQQLRNEPVNPAVGNRVSVAIRLAGLTQKRVAADLQMTEPRLSDICRGRYGSNVQMDTAHRLAGYFGCLVDDLFPHPAAA